VDTIINGHIPVGTWNDLKEYADFTKDFVAFAVASANPQFGGAKANLQIAYDELKKK
jgi:hypothetical protein